MFLLSARNMNGSTYKRVKLTTSVSSIYKFSVSLSRFLNISNWLTIFNNRSVLYLSLDKTGEIFNSANGTVGNFSAIP